MRTYGHLTVSKNANELGLLCAVECDRLITTRLVYVSYRRSSCGERRHSYTCAQETGVYFLPQRLRGISSGGLQVGRSVAGLHHFMVGS